MQFCFDLFCSDSAALQYSTTYSNKTSPLKTALQYLHRTVTYRTGGSCSVFIQCAVLLFYYTVE
eukprot:m.78304 g.78304  ORF g.78304 m.78304 type:complete len:64 (-) comp11949_c0_seq1:987-1178(-)